MNKLTELQTAQLKERAQSMLHNIQGTAAAMSAHTGLSVQFCKGIVLNRIKRQVKG